MNWVRTALASAFVLLMLASGHLLMVAINAVESAPEGASARMFTDRPLREELELAAQRTRNPEHRALLQAAARRASEEGEAFALRTQQVTPILWQATIGLTALGALLMWWTSRLKSDAAQTIVGLFAGNLMWTGGVEYGLTIAARSLGVAKSVAVVNGQVTAVFGEYVLLKHSWGVLALVMGYLLFLESSRCPVFLFWRERVPTMRGALVTGRIDNYGPRSAFQYATTVWGFYLLLLWAYDESVFGVHGFFTTAVLFASLAGTVYCVWKLNQHTGWGPAIRYAVGAMIVAWTPLEIAGKWGLFREPWLFLHPTTLVIFFGGLGLGTWLLWKAQRRPARHSAIDV